MHAKPTPNPPPPTRPSCGQTNTCKNIRILRSWHYKFNFKVDISPDLQTVDTSIICGITEKSGSMYELNVTHLIRGFYKLDEIGKYYVVYLTSTCWLVMFLTLLRDLAKRQFQNMQNKFHLDIKCVSEANSSLIFTYDPSNQSLEPSLQERNSLVMFYCL